MEGLGFLGGREFPLQDGSTGRRNHKAKSQESGMPPQPILAGGPEERVGVRG